MVWKRQAERRGMRWWLSVLVTCVVFQIVQRSVVWPSEVNDGSIINQFVLSLLLCVMVFRIPHWRTVGRIVFVCACLLVTDVCVAWLYPLRYGMDVRAIGSLLVELQFNAYDYMSVSWWMAPIVMLLAAVLRLIVSACRCVHRALKRRNVNNAPEAHGQ